MDKQFERTFALADVPEKRSDGKHDVFSLAISSETPVLRYDSYEILDHGPGSIVLDRIRNGIALLFNHNTDDHLGVIADPRVGRDRVLRGEARFGESKLAKEKRADVLNGTLKWVSVSYRILNRVWERQPRGETLGTYRVTRWEPLEVSLVTVPADATVGVGRSIAPLTPTLDYLRERIAEIETSVALQGVSQLEREQQQYRVRLARLKT